MLVLTSTSCKHNHSKYRLYAGKLAALIKLAILIRFPEQTLEINMEKRKRFSTLAGSGVRNRTYLYLWLITVFSHSSGTSFASTLSIKKSALLFLSGKDDVFIVKSLLQRQGLDLLKWGSITLEAEPLIKTWLGLYSNYDVFVQNVTYFVASSFLFNRSLRTVK